MASGWIIPYQGKRGTRYRVRMDYGPHPQTGKLQQPYAGSYATEREAERAIARLVHQAEQGQRATQTRLSIRELLVEWLDTEARRTVRPTTLEDYESTVRVHIVPALGAIQVRKLTSAQVQRFEDALAAAGAGRRTVELCHLRLQQALDYGVRMGYMGFNAAKSVKPPRPERREMQVWTAKQAAAFLSVASRHSYHPFWYLALHTGMRRGELLGLRWEDVDWDRGLLAVRRAIGPLDGRPHLDATKNGRARTIDLDEENLAVLSAHRAAQAERLLQLGKTPDWLICSAVGTTLNPNNVTRAFHDLLTEAKLPRIRIHDLRHTAATLMLIEGVPVKVVSERLGHASVTITLNLYAHVLPGMQREAAKRLTAALRGGASSAKIPSKKRVSAR